MFTPYDQSPPQSLYRCAFSYGEGMPTCGQPTEQGHPLCEYHLTALHEEQRRQRAARPRRKLTLLWIILGFMLIATVLGGARVVVITIFLALMYWGWLWGMGKPWKNRQPGQYF
jgi:predicted nucleic acid-binding Zn ribbon protein